MTRRVMAAVAAILSPRDDGAHVHFHSGPEHHPMPCFEPRCSNPRLTEL
jgi:hypothetical protein